MRVIKAMLASGFMLAVTVATAIAAPLGLQDPQPPVQVDVHTTETHTVWYTDPIWLAVGGLAVLLIIVLAVMAARSRGSDSSTTVIR